jgi:hypothetical protein
MNADRQVLFRDTNVRSTGMGVSSLACLRVLLLRPRRLPALDELDGNLEACPRIDWRWIDHR